MSVPTEQDNAQVQLPDDISNDPNISDAERALIQSGAPNPNDAPEPEEATPPEPIDPPVETGEVDQAAIEQALNGVVEEGAIDPAPESQPQPQPEPTPLQQQDEPDFDGQMAVIKQQADDLATQRTAIIEQYKTLGDQLDGGEIGTGAYNAQKLELEERLAKVNRQLDNCESQAQAVEAQAYQHVSAAEQVFGQAVSEFMARPENSVFVEGSQAWAILDQQVRVLSGAIGNTVTPAELLQKARAATAVIINLPAVPNAAVPATQPAPKPAKQKLDLPPTLGDMTSFENNQASSGEFDHILRLTGSAFDDAVASLTDDQFSRMSKALNQRGGR